jgi:hypothetical protein
LTQSTTSADSTSTESWFAAASRLDALAESYRVGLAPIRFAVAATAADRDAVYRLRCRAVIDRGWGRPDDFPDGRERDGDDDRAVFVAAWEGSRIVGAARIIYPTAGERLPVEALYGINVEPQGCVVQVDRVTVDRSLRDRRSRVLLGLVTSCWLEMRQHGFHVWAGIVSQGMFRLYRGLGFEATILAPPRRFWGEGRLPVRFDPVGVADAICDRLGREGENEDRS